MPVGLEQRSVSFEQGGIWNQSLGQQIEYLGINWHREGLPSNWADLPGVGFMIKKQMKMLQAERTEVWLAQTEQDIKGFELEYLARGLVFPIFYIYEVGGEDRLTAPLYGNKRVVETISSEERNGSVKKAFEGKIEPFLINAPDGSIAVMTSPDGWSGLHDEQSHEIIYLDSQTYLWQKRGREIVGFTIRTDFSKQEHREFLARLGAKKLSDDASVEEYVGNVVLRSSEDYKGEIEDIIDVMQDVRYNFSMTPFVPYKGRTWEEVYQNLRRRDELWRFDKRTKKIVNEFRSYVLNNSLSTKEIQEALAVTILRLARFLGEKGDIDSRRLLEDWQVAVPYTMPYAVSYGSVFEELKEQGGCAGGGESESDGIDKILVNSFTPRRGLRRRKKEEKFTCPKCNYTSEMPVGDKCPSCGLTKEEYAKKGGKPCS